MLKICLTVLAQLPIVAPRCPPSGQAAKQYGEVSEWLKEHAWKVCIRQRIGGSNPPLTAIFKMRARTKVRAFFFYILRKGGMRTPDRGSTTGAASWTDYERSEQAARRASEASQSPPVQTEPPHLQKKSPYKSTGLSQPFLSYSTSLRAVPRREKKPDPNSPPLHPYAPPASNPHF